MSQVKIIKATPWDTAAFGMPTWEILEYSASCLKKIIKNPGHYTIKVDPLKDKKLLHELSFYYCDTLIEPHCNVDQLRFTQHSDATISKIIDFKQALAICHGAFVYGRFHRDFNLDKRCADLRYNNWLQQLLESHQVYGLYWQGELAGFIGYNGSILVLHALSEKYRGQGLSKYWWSAVCLDLFESGSNEIKSSISVANLPVINLYASLGFSFKSPQDLYHCFVESINVR